MKRWWFAIPILILILVWLGTGRRTASADLAQVTPLPPVEHPDGRVGTCYSYYPNPPYPYIPEMMNAGSRWDRFDFVWPNLETSNDTWNWSAYDTLVSNTHGLGMDIVGILLWTPTWAATSPRTAPPVPTLDPRLSPGFAPGLAARLAPYPPGISPSPPQGLYLDWDDPGNYWGDFVYETVLHFKDDVQHWEIWNEPEWDYFWTGTSTDYARLLTVGYQATKAACPECTVLFGGLHYWANPVYYRWVLNTISQDATAAANNYYFDVMSIHLYSGSANVYYITEEIRAGMTTFVSDHPIWLTETGVPVWGDPYTPYPKTDYFATPDEAGLYVLQSYANAWAADIDKYFFFRANDQDMGEYFGLMRNDMSYRPSYVALQVAASHMVSPTMVTQWNYGNGVRRVTLWGTPAGKLSVLWNTTPTSVTFSYPAILTTALQIDRWGVTQTITATAGAHLIDLPGATANTVSDPNYYIIGGETYLVIESDTSPPTTATVNSLPTTTYAFDIPVSWYGSDAETGIWMYDIQVQQDGGPWTNWLTLTTSSSGNYAGGVHGSEYCFRARAWDNAGNPGTWPAAAQACTTLDIDRQVHFTLGTVFADENSNGVSDSGEISLTVQLQLVNASGTDVITPALGNTWEFTSTLLAGNHTLIATYGTWPSAPPGWMPRRRSVNIGTGPDLLSIDIPELGLFPHRNSLVLPLITRSSQQ